MNWSKAIFFLILGIFLTVILMMGQGLIGEQTLDGGALGTSRYNYWGNDKWFGGSPPHYTFSPETNLHEKIIIGNLMYDSDTKKIIHLSTNWN